MADDEIKKVRQQLVDELKQAKDKERSIRDEFNKDLEESTVGTTKEFKNVISSLAQTRPEAAKIVSEFKGLSADTFKGAVLNRDLIKGMSAATEMAEKGWSNLTEEQQDILSEVFGGQVARMQGLEKEEEKFTKLRRDSLIRQAETQQKITDLDTAMASEKESALADAMQAVRDAEKKAGENEIQKLDFRLQAELTQAKNALAEQEAQQDKILTEKFSKERGFLDQEMKGRSFFVEEHEKSLTSIHEHQKSAAEELKAAIDKSKETQMEGLSNFSDGLKELTGMDIMGAFDGATKKLNALGKVFGGDGVLGDKIMGNLGRVMQDAGKGIGKAAGSLKKSLGGMLKGGMTALRGAFTAVGTSLAAAGTALMTTLTAFATGAAAFIGGLLMTAGGMLLAAAPYILAGIAIVGLVLAGMKLYEESEKFKAAVDTVIQYFIDIKDSIFKIFGGFFDFFKGLFTGDFDMMFGGLKDMFGGIWDLIKAPFKAIGDFFKNVFGIDIGKFISDMAKKILPDWAVRLIFGSGEEAPEMTEEEQEAGQEGAEESGLYTKRGLRASLVNLDMVKTAPTNQLEAILNDDDIAAESYEAIQKELESRKSIIADYDEAKAAMDAGAVALADGTDPSLAMEFTQDAIAERGGAIDAATIAARPDDSVAAQAAQQIVQQNNNNSSTNIMNDTSSARDENDRYYQMIEGVDY
tara:strand:- start:461 stop:2545 length:2085 start_codon:yes stop_codon:yes gene_type:complete